MRFGDVRSALFAPTRQTDFFRIQGVRSCTNVTARCRPVFARKVSASFTSANLVVRIREDHQ
jgi:hypothetical protein